MNTSLLAQTESQDLVVLCESNPRTAAKHAAACEKARKAYLRAVYGFQPRQGHECGFVLSAVAHGSVVAVEIRFFVGEKAYNGMFELPLHVFKKDGASLTSSTAIKDFVGRAVMMTVIDRYQFNGISLSNVGAIDLYGTVVHVEPKWASVDVVSK